MTGEIKSKQRCLNIGNTKVGGLNKLYSTQPTDREQWIA